MLKWLCRSCGRPSIEYRRHQENPAEELERLIRAFGIFSSEGVPPKNFVPLSEKDMGARLQMFDRPTQELRNNCSRSRALDRNR